MKEIRYVCHDIDPEPNWIRYNPPLFPKDGAGCHLHEEPDIHYILPTPTVTNYIYNGCALVLGLHNFLHNKLLHSSLYMIRYRRLPELQ